MEKIKNKYFKQRNLNQDCSVTMGGYAVLQGTVRGSSIKYVSNIFRKTNISDPMTYTGTYVCVSGR